MRRLILTALTVAGLGALGDSSLWAQRPGFPTVRPGFPTGRPGFPPTRPVTNPYYRSPVSPIININRFGTSPGVNYYALIRPQQEAASGIQQLQYDLQAPGLLSQQVADTQQSTLATGGYLPRFFNYSHYFGNYPYYLPPVTGPGR